MNFYKASKIVFFVYIAIVLFMSFYRFGPDIQTGNDKINHAAAFVVFAVLYYFAWNSCSLPAIFGYGMGLGIFIEIVQYFLKYRSAEFGDLLSDLAGLAVGFMIVKFLSSRNKKRANAP
ncbi:MAG: VanZ family protein [Firmicutes bacterium]|nr:VanZ family protein [Bacillota bacterium]